MIAAAVFVLTAAALNFRTVEASLDTLPDGSHNFLRDGTLDVSDLTGTSPLP